MKISEINLEVIKTYCRIDGNEDDLLLQMYLDGAKKHIAEYIGLSIDELDTKEDLTLVMLAMISDLEKNREYTGDQKENIFFEKMLSKYAINLL